MSGSGTAQNTARGNARFIGDVPGRFAFLDRADEWEGQSFPFSARSVATTRAVVTTDVAVERGERLALRFDDIGVRRGIVERTLKEGFIVNFADGASIDEPVDARIDWLNKKTRGRAEDRRQHKRVIPKTTAALIVLGTDAPVECRIRDMSASGTAVQASIQPAVGSLVAIGSVPGRVVRHFEGGFAVRFVELQELAELEALLTLRTRQERSLAARKLGFAG